MRDAALARARRFDAELIMPRYESLYREVLG
jgi:hypothetical protein